MKMSEIYIIYHDVPNNYDVGEYAETLGFCYSEEEAQKVTKEIRKQRHPKNALIPYSPVYPGRVYFNAVDELKSKGKDNDR